VVFKIDAVRGPGHYFVKLNQRPADNSYVPRGEPEERPVAFNVDSRVEGSLSRVAESEIQERMVAGLQKGQLKLSLQESLAFVQSTPWFDTGLGAAGPTARNKSWSDYSWVLFLFLGLLALEQWLAMTFSHHLKEGAVPAPPQSARPRVLAPAATAKESSEAMTVS
jgi:hypothetical protein